MSLPASWGGRGLQPCMTCVYFRRDLASGSEGLEVFPQKLSSWPGGGMRGQRASVPCDFW